VDLLGAMDELYRLPPSDFTARRSILTSEARKNGDSVLADAIERLRKPNTSAWLANLLVRERPRAMKQIFELGSSIREAQGNLAGDELRHLARERHELLNVLVTEARNLASGLGHDVSESAIAEFRGTLMGAVSDEQMAEALDKGTLTKALHYAGTGFTEDSESDVTREGTSRRTAEGGRKNGRAATAAVRRAKDDASEAKALANAASRAARKADQNLEQIRRRIVDSEEALAQLRHLERDALKRASQARKDEVAAATARHRAERALNRLQVDSG
jgi:hypothetical protein